MSLNPKLFFFETSSNVESIMAESFKDKVEDAGHKIAEKATEVGHKVGEKAEEAADWVKEKAHQSRQSDRGNRSRRSSTRSHRWPRAKAR